MGRSTHNRSTRPRNNIRPIRNLESLCSSPVAPAKIPHVDLPLSEEVAKIQEAFTAFCDALNDAASFFENNKLIIAEAENKVLDLLHESELLPKLNAPSGYRFYQELRDVRIRRRVAKRDNAVLAPIYEYIIENAAQSRAISDAVKRSVYLAECADHDEYIYRIQPKKADTGDTQC